MVRLPRPYLLSCTGLACYLQTPALCQASGRAEPWMSLGWLLPQDPSPDGALLQYLLRAAEAPGLEPPGSCEMGDEGRRSTVYIPWLKVWHGAGAGLPLHVAAVPSLLSLDHSFWPKRTYQRMQERASFFLSSAIGEFCGTPSLPRFTTWAFIKGLCPCNCETWDAANAEKNKICLEVTKHLPCHEMQRQPLCMGFLITS